MFGAVLLAPYVLLLVAFGLGPVVYALVSSIATPPIFSAYVSAVSDFRFLPALGNVAMFTAVYLPVMFFGVLAIALLLDLRQKRFASSLLLVYTLPGTVTGAAAVLLWYVMLQPELSPFGPALKAMGFESTADVFRDQTLVPIFAAMAFAAGFGQWALIVTGSLKSISTEVLDAARIDGCSAFQVAFYVKLPMVRRTIVFMLILSFANAVQIFVEPQLLSGLVATAGSKWWSLNQLGLTFAFTSNDFASAAALALMLFVASFAVAYFVITRGKFMDTEHQE